MDARASPPIKSGQTPNAVTLQTGSEPAGAKVRGRKSTAKELALAEADAGADIIFAAAGGSGLGVFNAAPQGTFKAIGADVNQCLIDPDHIMLSAIRKIDVGIKDGIKAAIDGTREGGTMVPEMCIRDRYRSRKRLCFMLANW